MLAWQTSPLSGAFLVSRRASQARVSSGRSSPFAGLGAFRALTVVFDTWVQIQKGHLCPPQPIARRSASVQHLMLLTWRKQERAIVRPEHMKRATRAMSHFRKIQRFELISGQKFEKHIRHKHM
jgi:hypothetical protein